MNGRTSSRSNASSTRCARRDGHPLRRRPDTILAEAIAAAHGLVPRGHVVVSATRRASDTLPVETRVHVSYANMAGALVRAGSSESFARLSVGMTRSFDEVLVGTREGRTPRITTPARFEDAADELARACHAT